MTIPHTPTTQRVDYLCQCGWGRMGALEGFIRLCPVCGYDFNNHVTDAEHASDSAHDIDEY